MTLLEQPVVKVWRRTETARAPRLQGATTENKYRSNREFTTKDTKDTKENSTNQVTQAML